MGGLLAISAIQLRSLPLFLAAMVLIGVGTGTASLARYAAADLSTPERRGRDIGTVILASTFGAVLFPLFMSVGEKDRVAVQGASDLSTPERRGAVQARWPLASSSTWRAFTSCR